MCRGRSVVEGIGDPFYFAMLEGDVADAIFCMIAASGKLEVGCLLKCTIRPCFTHVGDYTFNIGIGYESGAEDIIIELTYVKHCRDASFRHFTELVYIPFEFLGAERRPVGDFHEGGDIDEIDI